MKKGTRVKFTKKARKFYARIAYESNSVSGKVHTEQQAFSYLLDALLGAGFPYKAKVTEYRKDTDCYKVCIDFGYGFVNHMFYEAKELRKVRKK